MTLGLISCVFFIFPASVFAQEYNSYTDVCCKCTRTSNQSAENLCLFVDQSKLTDSASCETLANDVGLDLGIVCEAKPLTSDECAIIESNVAGICNSDPMRAVGTTASEEVSLTSPTTKIPPINYEANVPIPGFDSVVVENDEANPLFAIYLASAYRYLLSITAIAATIMFIWGAFLYLVGSSIDKIGKGKEIMRDSIIGAFLLIGAVTILRTLNPDLVEVNNFDVTGIQTRLFYEDIPPTSIITDPITRIAVPVTGKSKGNSCYLNTFGASDAEIKRRTKRITFLGDTYVVHELAAADFQEALNEIENAPAGTAVGQWVAYMRRMPPYSGNCGKKTGYPDAGSRTGGSYAARLDAKLAKAKAAGTQPCLSCDLHALALAIDFDSCHNPMCPAGKKCTLTDPKYNNIPPEVVAVFAKYNIYWGGYGWKAEGRDWSAAVTRRDAMHFEWHGACRG